MFASFWLNSFCFCDREAQEDFFHGQNAHSEHELRGRPLWEVGEKHKVWIHLASTYGITMILNRSNAIYGSSLEAFQIRATFREFGWTGFSTG